MDGRSWLNRSAAQAIAAGAGALSVILADVISEGDKLGTFIEIAAGECALVMARASPSIADLDLFAYEDDGSIFAADESPDAEAGIVVCPPHPRRLYVVARGMSGAGVIGVGLQSVPPSSASAVAKAVGARGRPGDETGRLDSWPGLETKIRARRAFLGGQWDDIRRAALPVSPRAPSRISVPLDAGRCLDVLVAPSEEVASLEVLAEDPAGRVVARGRDLGRDRALLICSAVPVELTLAIRPRSTQGIVAVIAARSPVGAAANIDPGARAEYVTATLDLSEARKAHERALGGRGYGPPRTIAQGSAKVGSRLAFPVDLRSGCWRIDVVAGKPLADVSAALWSDRAVLLAESRAGAGAALFTCGPGGPVRIDLEAMVRPGPFVVELRQDRAAPAALVAHPIAAARMLSRLNALAEPRDASAAASAQVVALDSSSFKTIALALPESGCVEVIAAVDSGGSGLDLRLVDSSTGENVVTRARYLAVERLCGTGAKRAGAAEVRLSAGKADALVLVRELGGP
jgi:hypothetical protein